MHFIPKLHVLDHVNLYICIHTFRSCLDYFNLNVFHADSVYKISVIFILFWLKGNIKIILQQNFEFTPEATEYIYYLASVDVCRTVQVTAGHVVISSHDLYSYSENP